jgi:hypothetical protein
MFNFLCVLTSWFLAEQRQFYSLILTKSSMKNLNLVSYLALYFIYILKKYAALFLGYIL